MRTCKQCKFCSSAPQSLADGGGNGRLTSPGPKNCEIGKKTKIFDNS